MNAEKFSLCAIELEFVGCLLTQTGYKPLSKLIKAALKMTPPKNISPVHAFNGTVSFIKNHVMGQAKILEPITGLTNKDTEFKWDKEQQKAFEKNKAKVVESIMLINLN